MKNKIYLIAGILMLFVVSVALFVFFNKTDDYEKLFELKGYKTGDVKFYKHSNIIGGKDGFLHIINLDSKVDKTLGVKVNWIDTIPDENIIIYGNFNNQVGILKLDDDNNIVENNVVIKGDNLRIDPSIVKIDGEYYFTATKIIGEVNNADPKKENGVYTIELYKTKDLKHISKVSDVLSKKNNLEDVDILYKDGYLNISYEMETYDHGPSQIILSRSKDKGKSWEKEIPLVQDKGDNEPATLMDNGDSYSMFYSSDKEDLGKSYSGAKAYYKKYDRNFNLIGSYPITLRISKNMILFEIRKLSSNNMYEALYVNDYAGDGNIFVDLIKLKK